MIDGPLPPTALVAFAIASAAAGFALIVARPQFGAYLFLIANPLIVGIARGDMIPMLRPNEAMLLLISTALGARTLLLMLAGRRYRFVPHRCEVALLLLAAASSVLPLLLRYGRGLPISADDILYAIVLWKYYLLYRVFRAAVSTPAQTELCLRLSMCSATLVALIAILQVNNLLGVPEFLHEYYDQPFDGHTGVVTERGTTTIGSSFGFADLMIMNLVIGIGFLQFKQRGRLLLIGLTGLFLSGCIVAGEFSSFLGLAVALLVVSVITGRLFRLASFSLPALLVASALFWPVIAGRVIGFSGGGVPQSWTARWENLQHFFLPDLFSGLNWVFGVRPAARLPAPETWREWVYIESGYVWLLWSGGIPFLAAFMYFVWVWARHLWRTARQREDGVGVAATAGFAYLMVIVTIMLFDPHLTIRGSADLFFPLLGLSFLGVEDGERTRLRSMRFSGAEESTLEPWRSPSGAAGAVPDRVPGRAAAFGGFRRAGDGRRAGAPRGHDIEREEYTAPSTRSATSTRGYRR